MTSRDVFLAIKDKSYVPNFSKFEWFLYVLVSNNTKFDKAMSAMENLKFAKVLSIKDLLNCENLEDIIKVSGFYKTKAKIMKTLANEILNDYSSFENFIENFNTQWLYEIKGVGFESADMIALFVCDKDIMPVSLEARKIFNYLNFEFESYFEAREWLDLGEEKDNKIYYFAIKDFVKKHFKGKEISQNGAIILDSLR